MLLDTARQMAADALAGGARESFEELVAYYLGWIADSQCRPGRDPRSDWGWED